MKMLKGTGKYDLSPEEKSEWEKKHPILRMVIKWKREDEENSENEQEVLEHE